MSRTVDAIFDARVIDEFRAVLTDCMGLVFDDSKAEFLGVVLGRRLEATGRAAMPYLNELRAGGPRSEIDALAGHLTVPETYFFRNIEQFRALVHDVVPERMRARRAERQLRFLSAGCASGEEAYSLAIALRDCVDRSWQVTVLGVDLNPAALERANRARYSSWALRGVPADVGARWFHRDGHDFVLDETIRASVRFERRNLVEATEDLWRPETFDVIFCRNVMMYFSPQRMREVVERLAGALVPGGYLFLGHAETLRGLSHDFHLHHAHGTFYYQRKHELTTPNTARDAAEPTAPIGGDDTPLAELIDRGGTWTEAIRLATERVETLTSSVSESAVDPNPTKRRPPPSPRWHLGTSLELLRQERFADALEALGSLPVEAASDPDVCLLEAALLAQSGALEQAEAACKRVLALDELNAGAHYLLALCDEASGNDAAAAEHDRAAMYLDPTFAMPHLHLGLLSRRIGDREQVQRELGQAMTLLRREDPARVLMFGGGFSRDALVALCDAQLLSGERS